MIHVQRHQTDEDGIAISPSDAWRQLAASSTEIAIQEGIEHTAARSVYANHEVKKALEKLFHNKCAYCESKVTGTADWEVEHFRPKGRVAEREDHPGYYWLTYAWENLYPSCQHCNQRRKDQPLWDDPAELPSGGKVDQFPLLDEGTRAMEPADDVRAERTLLIDPCFDDPEEYFGYDPTGAMFSLSDNPYGEATLEALHLSRRRLRVCRLLQLKIAEGALRAATRATDPAAIDELRMLLDRLQSDEAEFAGLVRYVVTHPTQFGI